MVLVLQSTDKTPVRRGLFEDYTNPNCDIGTKVTRCVSFEVALFLNWPHPACPDGENDGELVASLTDHSPVFPQFAASGGELRENWEVGGGAIPLSPPSDSPSGQAGWGLTQSPRFLDPTRPDDIKLRNFKKHERGRALQRTLNSVGFE